jgi:hypothetical protein
MSQRIKDRIHSAMELGALCDEYSDNAYAGGRLATGDYWAKKAIAYYTEAEKLSEYSSEFSH